MEPPIGGKEMKMQDKIILLRKKNGWSQEDLAEKMNVSRQAVSRWENGTALPDAANVLEISKLFGVTADYILNDDYESDEDIAIVKETKKEKDELVSKKKMLHLIAAVSFFAATLCSIAGIATSTSATQLTISAVALLICLANAVAQVVLFVKKN